MEAGRKSRLEQVDRYRLWKDIERMDLEEKGEMERTTVSLPASLAGSLLIVNALCYFYLISPFPSL